MRLARSLLLVTLAIAIAGCFLMTRSLRRPDPSAVSGPVPYVENCAACHAGPTISHYAESRHAAAGIRCGQCHTPGAHPDFSRPVADGKCGGCHQPQYQQTLASKHYAGRLQRSLDSDPAARAALRRDGFTAATAPARVDLGLVQRASFCVGCHLKREQHFPDGSPDAQNRCVTCHVRVGETVAGQVVNTHRFAVPGTEGAGQ